MDENTSSLIFDFESALDSITIPVTAIPADSAFRRMNLPGWSGSRVETVDMSLVEEHCCSACMGSNPHPLRGSMDKMDTKYVIVTCQL